MNFNEYLFYQVCQYLECNKLMKESLLWSMCGEWWWWCVYNIIWVAGLTLDKAVLIPVTITINHIHFSINGHNNNYC